MPAPRELHEQILDELWEIYNTDIREKYGSGLRRTGVMFSLAAPLAKMVMGINDKKNRIADFYLDPYDGHGPIMGEVGEMQSDKWCDVDSYHGVPIRVLRVGFDRSIGMMNPRFTEREIRILKILQNRLWDIQFEDEI